MPERSLSTDVDGPGGGVVDPQTGPVPRAAQVSDLVLALLLCGLAGVLLRVLSNGLGFADWLFVPLVVLPLALRRSRPRTSAALVLLAALAQAVLAVPIGFHDAAVLLALGTLGGWTDRRTGLAGLGGGLVLVAVGAGRSWWGYLDRRLGADSSSMQVMSTAGAAVLVVAAWAFGEQARRAREGDLAVRQRAAQLERERSQLAELSAAAERTRIAREMHDVVAHGLTVMIVQADGAAYVLPEGAEDSRAALAQISSTGRAALQEMRQLLGLLRADDPAVPASVVPTPGLQRLDALVAEARTAGAAVTLEIDGDLTTVSDLTSLTAYRVVQESLTNARRHGGSVVTVTVRRTEEELVVSVQDSGREPVGGAGAASPGVGLTGLRERVTATGGRTRVGPVAGGGFAVTAWMPVAASGARAAALPAGTGEAR